MLIFVAFLLQLYILTGFIGVIRMFFLNVWSYVYHMYECMYEQKIGDESGDKRCACTDTEPKKTCIFLILNNTNI